MMLLSSTGVEKFLQFGWPEGQTTWLALVGNAEVKVTVLCIVASPAGWLVELMTEKPVQFGFVVGSHPGGGTLASGAPSVLKSTPAVAVESLVTTTSCHLPGDLGLRCMSVPLTFCSRRPPPLPLSAVLPWTRLALKTRPGPTPSESAGGQSMSIPAFSQAAPSGPPPWRITPPPWVVSVELKLWLKRNELCSISAFQLKPL